MHIHKSMPTSAIKRSELVRTNDPLPRCSDAVAQGRRQLRYSLDRGYHEYD